jgi:hypothetical protein
VGPAGEREEARDGRAVANVAATKARRGNNTTATITATMAIGAKGVTVDDGVVTTMAKTVRMGNDTTATITATMASGAKGPKVDQDVVTATATPAMTGSNATATITATTASGAKGATVDDGIVTTTAMTVRMVYCPSMPCSTMSTTACPLVVVLHHRPCRTPPLMFRGVKLSSYV